MSDIKNSSADANEDRLDEHAGLEEAPEHDEDDDAIRRLLKSALVEPAQTEVPDVVAGVQRKLRKRSRGKFYADGWSTATSRTNYVLVAVAMLLIVGIAYLVLGPTGISR